MSRKCTLTGKKRNIANNVSHANNKTKKQQQVNLHSKKVFDPSTGRTYKVKLSARAIKSLDRPQNLAKLLKKIA